MSAKVNEQEPPVENPKKTPGAIKRGLSVFRLKGLIPFLLIVGGVFLLSYLFADPLARRLLESNLTRIQGAQVDVASADVMWQPFGLVTEGVAFTDPDQPNQNALDVERASMQLDTLALLTGKVVFESLAVDGLRFNTPRANPGRVLEPPVIEESIEPTVGERAMDTVELPSPSDALSQHRPLQTEVRAEAALDTRDRVGAAVQQRAEDLPDEQSLQEHRDRLQRLQDTEFDSLQSVQEVRQEVQALTEDVVRDRQAIVSFLDTVNSADEDVRQALEALLAGPGADMERLRSTYNLTPDGQVALAGLLLGDQWAAWVADGQRWYAMAEPWVTRLMNWQKSRASAGSGYVSPGYYVVFPEDNPIPGFWLKQGTLTAVTEGGEWGGSLVDLSSDPVLIDRPARFDANSTELDAAESADLAVVWDWRDDNLVHVGFNVDSWRVGGWQIEDKDLPIGLQSATTQMKLDASFNDGWQGALSWQFGSSEFGIPANWNSGNLLRRTLEQVDEFNVTAELSGRSVFPRTRWRSDLDDQFAEAVRDAVGVQVAEWEGQVRAELDARRAELEAPVRTELARLGALEEEWTGRKDALENEVLATLSNFESQLVNQRERLENRVDEERQALEQRAQEEQEALEQRLREEREAAEQRAREEAERGASDLLRGLNF